MPNWVSCTAHVSGPAEDMARFFAAARKGNRFHLDSHKHDDWGGFTDIQLESLMQEALHLQDSECKDEFSFHGLYPVPLGVQVMPYDSGDFSRLLQSNPAVADFCQKHGVTMGGYDWERVHWGVKWGNCSTEIPDISDTHVTLYFDTAWGPPHEFWQKVSADYPTLTITMSYTEEGGFFEGEATYEAGQVYIDEWEPEHESEDESESYQDDGEE
jgi:hypothetical protein